MKVAQTWGALLSAAFVASAAPIAEGKSNICYIVPKLSALLRCKMTINWARLFDHARAIVQTHIRPPSTCPFCLPSDSFAQSLLHQGLTPSFVHVAYASCLLEIH